MPGPNRDPSGGDRRLLAERRHDDATPASIAAVYAVATALDTDPIACSTDLGFTLYDHVDPEALDTLLGDDRPTGTVTVELAIDDHLLRITDTGSVQVLGPPDSIGDPDA